MYLSGFTIKKFRCNNCNIGKKTYINYVWCGGWHSVIICIFASKGNYE